MRTSHTGTAAEAAYVVTPSLQNDLDLSAHTARADTPKPPVTHITFTISSTYEVLRLTDALREKRWI